MGARPPESEFPAHPGFRYPEVLVAPLEVSTLPRPLTGEPNGQTQQTNLFAKRKAPGTRKFVNCAPKLGRIK